MSADPKGLLPGEKIIWDGTTWPHGLFSWCCCSQNFFTVSNKSIKTATGCCKSKEDVMDMRRVTDIQFERSCFQLLCCRGTVIIYAAEEKEEKLVISTWGMKKVYEELRDAWLQSRNGVAVNVGGS